MHARGVGRGWERGYSYTIEAKKLPPSCACTHTKSFTVPGDIQCVKMLTIEFVWFSAGIQNVNINATNDVGEPLDFRKPIYSTLFNSQNILFACTYFGTVSITN